MVFVLLLPFAILRIVVIVQLLIYALIAKLTILSLQPMSVPPNAISLIVKFVKVSLNVIFVLGI